MDRALDIQIESPAALAGRVSLLRSPFVRRSVGIMAIGGINFLVLVGLGATFFMLIPARTRWGLGSLECVDLAMNAILTAFCVLFAAFLVLVKQSLLQRAVAGIVVLFFLAIVLSSPGVMAAGMKHFLVFWLCVVILIPLRALGCWSIHWSDQVPRLAGTGQFSLADLLSWTTAVAAMIGFFRLFGPALPATRIPLTADWISVVNCAGVAAVFIVAGPCLWLAASRVNRVRGSLWIMAGIFGVALLWGVAILIWDYVLQWWPWWQMVVYAFESLLYLLALEAALLANLFALEWLGLRWSRPNQPLR